MSFRASLRRAAVDRNVVMIVIAVVILLVAGVVLFTTSQEEAVVLSKEAEERPVSVTCSECQHTWTIPFKEYQELAKEAVSESRKIMCPQCKESGAWRDPPSMAVQGISEKDKSEAVDFLSGANTEGVSGDGAEDAYDVGGDDAAPRRDRPVGKPTLRPRTKPN